MLLSVLQQLHEDNDQLNRDKKKALARYQKVSCCCMQADNDHTKVPFRDMLNNL